MPTIYPKTSHTFIMFILFLAILIEHSNKIWVLVCVIVFILSFSLKSFISTYWYAHYLSHEIYHIFHVYFILVHSI